MSIIQQIREKYAAVGIGFIALSLIGFILMDSQKNSSGGIDPKDAIGEVNGKAFSYSEFVNKVKSIENMQEMNGRSVDEELRQQINAEVWRQMVERTIMEEEYEKLGITVSDKEFNDMLFGANPPEWLSSQFTDANTGKFDALAAKQAISQMKKGGAANTQMLEQFYLDPLLEQTLRNKYMALQRNSAFVPKFMVEKTLADNGAVAAFNFVQLPYAAVPDSAVQITDAMINKYVSEHPNEFKQEEPLRSIAYVSFPYNPSAQDTAAALTEIMGFKAAFDTVKNPGEFVTANNSLIPFADEYFSKTRIQIPQKDSIIGAGVGKVFGPYIDGNSYVLSRVVDVKTRPDSVKARHILVGTFDMQTQQVKLSDSVAKARIDSIEKVINAGGSFAALATALSDDKGSAEKGGDLGYFASGMMVKEFNDFCFTKTKGSRGVVKTQFGYHLIEITDQKNFEQAYKIAYMARPIEASLETVNNAMNQANEFAGNSRDLKEFDANALKRNLNKLVAPDIKENDYTIVGLGVNRSLVREIFEAEVGGVLEPYDINGQYIVIAVTGAEKSGLMSAAKARPMVEYIIRNQEKAKQIISKLGAVTTLEALAQKNNTVVQNADSVSFVSPMLGNFGYEPKVAGYAFAKVNLNKVSKPVAGNSGVYVLQTRNTGAGQVMGNPEETRMNLMNAAKSVAFSSSMQALRDRASIKDKRNKFL